MSLVLRLDAHAIVIPYKGLVCFATFWLVMLRSGMKPMLSFVVQMLRRARLGGKTLVCDLGMKALLTGSWHETRLAAASTVEVTSLRREFLCYCICKDDRR